MCMKISDCQFWANNIVICSMTIITVTTVYSYALKTDKSWQMGV